MDQLVVCIIIPTQATKTGTVINQSSSDDFVAHHVSVNESYYMDEHDITMISAINYALIQGISKLHGRYHGITLH
jgi:hypothetical protein